MFVHLAESRRKGPDFVGEAAREEWEEEQKRLDREWYSMDEGYDESHNPFSNTSKAYAEKKEKEMEEKKKKRMTARQQQIHKDNEMWEINRMLRSGAVIKTEYECHRLKLYLILLT